MSIEVTRRGFFEVGMAIAVAAIATNHKQVDASETKTIIFAPGIYSDPNHPEFLATLNELSISGIKLNRVDITAQDCVNRRSYLQKFHLAVLRAPGRIDLAGYSQGGGVIQMYLDEYQPRWEGNPKIDSIHLISSRNLYEYDPIENDGQKGQVPKDLRNFYRRIDSPNPLLTRIGGSVNVFYGDADESVLPKESKGLAKALGVEPISLAGVNHDQIANRTNLTKILKGEINLSS